MGQDQANQILSLGKTTIYMSSLLGTFVIVDLYGWIYRMGIGQRNSGSDIMDKNNRYVGVEFSVVKLAVILMNHGIKPIFVCDGKSSAIKADEVMRRKNEREKSMNKLNDLTKLLDEMNHDMEDYSSNVLDEHENESSKIQVQEIQKELVKMSKRSFHPMKENIDNAIDIVQKLGIQTIRAKGEGEACCVEIAKFLKEKGVQASIMSDDFDTLLFGADSFIKLGSVTSPVLEEYTIERILKNIRQNINKLNPTPPRLFNEKDLLNICCLMGREGCEGLNVQGIDGDFTENDSTSTSKKRTKLPFDRWVEIYVKHDMDINKLLNHFERIDYLEKINAVEHEMKYHVNTPITFDKLELKTPDEKMFTKAVCDFLDPEMIKEIIELVENNYKISHGVSSSNFGAKSNANFDPIFGRNSGRNSERNSARSYDPVSGTKSGTQSTAQSNTTCRQSVGSYVYRSGWSRSDDRINDSSNAYDSFNSYRHKHQATKNGITQKKIHITPMVK
jgi:5'-3' exonuclease